MGLDEVEAVPFYKFTMTDRRKRRLSSSLMEGCTLSESEINGTQEPEIIDLEDDDVKLLPLPPPLAIQPMDNTEYDDDVEFLGIQQAKLDNAAIKTEEQSGKKEGNRLNDSDLTEKSVPERDEKRSEVERRKRPSERDKRVKASSSTRSNANVPSTSKGSVFPTSTSQASSASRESLHRPPTAINIPVVPRGGSPSTPTITPNVVSASTRKSPNPPPTSNYEPQKAPSGSTAHLRKQNHQEASTSRNSSNSRNECRTSSTWKRPESSSTVKSNSLSDPPDNQPQNGPSNVHVPRSTTRRDQPSNDAPIIEVPDSDRGKPDAIFLTYKGEKKCYKYSGEEEEEMISQKVPKVTKDSQTSASLLNGQPVVKPPVDLRPFNVPQDSAPSKSRTASKKSPGPPILSPQRNGDPLYESERRDRHRYAPRDRNSGPSSPSPLKKDFRDKGSLISFIRWCHMCSRDFPNRSAATRHKTKEHNKRHCPVCFLLLSTKGNVWKNHLLEHHDLGGEKVLCLYCKNPFNFDGLYKHLSKQHLKPYEDSLLNNPRPPRNQPPSTSRFSRNASSMPDPRHNRLAYQQESSRHSGTTSAAATGPVPSTSYASQPQSQSRDSDSRHSSMNYTNPLRAGYRRNVRQPLIPLPSSSSTTSTRIIPRSQLHRDRDRHSQAKDNEKYKK